MKAKRIYLAAKALKTLKLAMPLALLAVGGVELLSSGSADPTGGRPVPPGADIF